jgi:tryptophan synthase alpha subunit
MSHMTLNYPHQTREDAYYEVLDAFLRRSADYFELGVPTAEQATGGTGTKKPTPTN